jgi:hypothetical protein
MVNKLSLKLHQKQEINIQRKENLKNNLLKVKSSLALKLTSEKSKIASINLKEIKMKKLTVAVFIVALLVGLTTAGCEADNSPSEPSAPAVTLPTESPAVLPPSIDEVQPVPMPTVPPIRAIDDLINIGFIQANQMECHPDARICEINPETTLFYETDFMTVYNLMKNSHESFVLYVGFGDCPWCQDIFEPMVSAANDTELERIIYVNRRSEINSFPNEENNWRPSDMEITLMNFLMENGWSPRERQQANGVMLQRMWVPEVIVWNGEEVTANFYWDSENIDHANQQTLTSAQTREIYLNLVELFQLAVGYCLIA